MSTVKGDTLYSQFKINVGDKVYITQKGELESVIPGYCHLECFTVVSKQADLPECNTYEIINGDTIWVVCDEDFEEGDLAIYQMLSPTEKLELWRRQGIDMGDDSSIANTTIPFDEECECHIKSWSQAEMNKQKMIEEDMEYVQVEDKPYNPLDVQHGGGHYKDRAIQPIEYIMSNGLDFCQGNIVKYVSRYKEKNGREDLEKAKHYVEFLIYQWDKEHSN